MRLQEFAMKQVKENGGLKYIIKQLDLLKPLVLEDQKYQIEEVKVYYELIHLIKVDMESDFIVYRDDIMRAVKMFNDLYETHHCLTAKMFHTILLEGFNKTKNIRMIS